MKVQNDHLPANHQDIDNIPAESDQEIEEIGPGKEIGEIVDLDVLSLDDLGELYDRYLYQKDDIESAITEIKKTIYDKQEVDSQKAGRYLSIKGKRTTFPDLTIDKARDLGLTKVEEKIDTKLVKKAHENGVDLGEVEYKTFHTMRFIKEDADSQD